MYCGSMRAQIHDQTLEDFLKYRGLYQLYQLAKKYLPTLPDPRDVYVVPWEHSPCSANIHSYGCTWRVDGRWYLSFREHIPSIFVILHELIHLAGGGEWEAYNYLPALWYAIRRGLEPFNLLKLRYVDLAKLDEISKRVFGISTLKLVIDYMGVVPWCVHMFAIDGDIVAKFREDLDDWEKGQCLLTTLLDGLDYNEPIAVKIFDKLVETLK